MIDYTLPLDQLPDPLPIEPLKKPFDVTITPPGSKSITCRAYVLAALAQGESKIIRPLRADDTDHLLNALCTLGAEARWVKSDEHDGEDVYIKGVNGRFPRGGNLYMGEGGTPTRFMIACACLAAEPVTIDASPRMRERPIAEGVDMLRQLGAKIEYVEEEGRLPVRVVPSDDFKGGKLEIGETASSQFISALILVGPCLSRGLNLRLGTVTSASYVELTLNVLKDFGGRICRNFFTKFVPDKLSSIRIRQNNLMPSDFCIESDASSAMYWGCATAPIEDAICKVMLLPETSKQPDVQALILAEAFGAEVCLNGQRADWHAHATFDGGLHEPLPAVRVDCRLYPDASVMLAVASSTLTDTSRFTGLRTLRVKETDRIAALANELRKVGCTVATGEDWIEITPPVKSSSTRRDAASDDRREEDGGGAQTGGASPPSSSPMTSTSKSHPQSGSSDAASPSVSPIIIETYNDHRMAMAFAVLGLNPPNGVPLAIRNPKCVAKSYPGFWKDFAKLYG